MIATVEILNDWNVNQMVVTMGFDTTSRNSSIRLGAEKASTMVIHKSDSFSLKIDNTKSYSVRYHKCCLHDKKVATW
jgi:hypothetical protein